MGIQSAHCSFGALCRVGFPVIGENLLSLPQKDGIVDIASIADAGDEGRDLYSSWSALDSIALDELLTALYGMGVKGQQLLQQLVFNLGEMLDTLVKSMATQVSSNTFFDAVNRLGSEGADVTKCVKRVHALRSYSDHLAVRKYFFATRHWLVIISIIRRQSMPVALARRPSSSA